MMVPRSFQYGSVTTQTRHFDEKESRRKNSYNSILSARIPIKPVDQVPITLPSKSATHLRRPNGESRAATAPLAIPSRPTDADATIMYNYSTKRTSSVNKSSSQHQPDALPPSVAALLAMTTIPPRRAHTITTRRQQKPASGTTSSMSIDELVSSWKNDSSLRSSVPSSPSMSMLLDDGHGLDSSTDDLLRYRKTSVASVDEPTFSRTCRSTSSDSVPSLDADEQSLLSVRSPSTPASLRSRRSVSNLRIRDRFKSSSVGEDCHLDHPLVWLPRRADFDEHDEVVDTFSNTKREPSTVKSRSSFRSNLTTSLQALKNAALGTLTFNKSSTTPSADSPSRGLSPNSNLSDDVLWQHPFLFPRLSSEIRPPIQGTPTQAQRRYLNPMPLTFEEQEAPFQQALHAPYLAQAMTKEGPAIQLQAYSRARRRTSRSSRPSRSVDPQSEAGRAQSLASSGIRQREARENSDFLRVVVLEMNMRRAGKLETGRAKIWLPPRQIVLERADDRVAATSTSLGRKHVPVRWTGISAA